MNNKTNRREANRRFHNHAKAMMKVVDRISEELSATGDLGIDEVDYAHVGTIYAARIDLANALGKLESLRKK